MTKDFNELPRAARDFLSYMDTIRNKSANTVREYAYDLRMFLRYTRKKKEGLQVPLEDVRIEDIPDAFYRLITLSDFYSFLTYLSRERKAAPRTRAR
ncbi:MAG: site-specific integrase, partial [Clostridia bacterium]